MQEKFDEILRELKAIRQSQEIQNRMLEDLIAADSERSHDAQKAKQQAQGQMQALFASLQANPLFKGNPVLDQMFSGLKEGSNAG